MQTSHLFILSGPSGAGEDSVINGLKERLSLDRIVTTTTRAMRPGESEGNPYYFLSKEAFLTKISAGEFVEYAEEYNQCLYGVTKEEIDRAMNSGKPTVWKIEWKGVQTAKKLFPEIPSILLTAPLDVLEARIRRRDNPDEAFLADRMAYTREWLNHQDIYDYVVENTEGKLEETIERVFSILKERGIVA